MIEMITQKLSLFIAEDGSAACITDRERHCSWHVDLDRGGYRLRGDRRTLRPLPAGAARRTDGGIEVRYPAGGGSFVHRYMLADDHVEVTLECDADEVESVSLPAPVRPDEGPRRVAAPIYQGMLLGPEGEEWERTLGPGGHFNFSMAMAAVLGERGGMVVCHESPSNWTVRIGRTAEGPAFQFVQERCPIEGWTGAQVRLYPTDSEVTAACKCYRARVMERGHFVSWAEKIERKPILRDLFGAAMAFIGYNECPGLDYASGAQALRTMGFESVFYYPVRMFQYSLDFQMGGDAPIWLSDEAIAAIKSVEGAHVAPWAWTVEGLDDGSEAMHAIFKKGADGKPIPNWKIDEQRWYLVCTPYQAKHVKEHLAGDMAAMDWIHFDVSAVWGGKRCFDSGHALHGNRPMGCLGDMDWTRRLFSIDTVGNRAISSEGFHDYHTGWYDIGSTKMMPPQTWDPGCVPLPMTMLVFHDSCIHDWWELHNYNAHAAFDVADMPHGLGRTGCGLPALKASLDALYGCPPNVFPFGKQYGWVNIETRETFSYLVRLEDEAVQEGLRYALPVSRLHKQVGPLEMTSFEFLSDDRAVQTTTFSDGTRVVANLSEREVETPGIGNLPPHSWRLIEEK
jgi:hypothetical protein